ncbi:MAG: hypothetical protein II349_00200 [Akkermansia sp.]|nr:hypothetical protein [Akkermansia sp.]
MKKLLLPTIYSLLCAGLSSCVTSAVMASAAGMKALEEASSTVSENVTGFFYGSQAPTNLADKIVSFTGTTKQADGSTQQMTDALPFAAQGVSQRTVGGQNQVLAYIRETENIGIITISTPAGIQETYTMNFSSADSGTYTYERPGNEAPATTGEGTFKIK